MLMNQAIKELRAPSFSGFDSRQIASDGLNKIELETVAVENVADVFLQRIVMPNFAQIVRIQSLWRGVAVRKKISIKSLVPGMVLVRLKGDRAIFGDMDFKRIFLDGNSPMSLRCVSYLTLEKSRFKGCVLAYKDKLINPVQLDLSNRDGLTEADHNLLVAINGGFFNYRRLASQDVADNVSVGRVVLRGKELASLPIPICYTEDYSPINFEDGSMLEVGPTLSQSGKVGFSEGKLADPKYDVQRNDLKYITPIVPGYLRHAAGRHPRAAISDSIGQVSGCVRLIVGTVPGRDDNPNAGFTLPEWACIAARIDRLSSPPNSSMNLDGGGSVSLVVRDVDGDRLTISQTVGGRDVANAIGFFKR